MQEKLPQILTNVLKECGFKRPKQFCPLYPQYYIVNETHKSIIVIECTINHYNIYFSKYFPGSKFYDYTLHESPLFKCNDIFKLIDFIKSVHNLKTK